jgi:nucleotide-binding universal stress UspA family protein
VVSSYHTELNVLGGGRFDVPVVGTVPEDTEARIRRLVADVEEELAGSVPGVRDVEVTVVASASPAVEALLERSEGADLLVVGSRGRGAMRSALLGSVALHCVTHAHCPVEVVHETVAEGGGTGRVVVGVDGSESSRAALAAAVDEAVRRGAEVEAVASYLPADYWTDLSTVVIPAIEEIRAGLEARTDLVVQDVLAERRGRGDAAPAVRIEVVDGPAAEVLLQRARSADLLVVGSRGRGAFRGLLLGSVALHCAMHAPCPVLVVHPQVSRSDAAASRAEPAMADR